MVSEARGSSLLFREVKHTSSKAEAGDSRGQTHDQGAQQGAETLFQGAHLRFQLIRGL